MHGISTFKADFQVKELQRKSLIYESSPTLRTHDLYIEFARFVVSVEGNKEKEWWVGHWDANGSNLGLKRLLLFRDESKICLPPKQLWECDLNVHGWKDQSKGCLPELRMVHLHGFDFRRIPFLRHCWNLTFLNIHGFDFDPLNSPQDMISFFENLKALEMLGLSSNFKGRFPSCVYDGILQCATKMKNLKHLKIEQNDFQWGEFSNKLDLSPLGPLTSLQTLSLPQLPRFITELVGLDQLLQLVRLNLEWSRGLWKLGNLDLLPNLRWICVRDCVGLKHLENRLERFEKYHSGYPVSHQCLKPRPMIEYG